MRIQAKKVSRRRPGEITVEQSRDPIAAQTLLRTAGMSAEERMPACLLIAYVGDDAVGIAGVETAVDAAVIGPLFVTPSVRRRGIGARLLRAARVAAHTRGARTMYKIVPPEAGGYLARFGFEQVEIGAASQALEGIAGAQRLRAPASEIQAWRLDISMDGIIER